MEIVEIDVLDGKGKIPVAVGDYLEAARLRKYITEATALFMGDEKNQPAKNGD